MAAAPDRTRNIRRWVVVSRSMSEMWRAGQPAGRHRFYAIMTPVTDPHRENSTLPEPQCLVATWRRFGPVGPVYEIVGLGKELPDHDRLMRVRVVETGEELDYRLGEILDDPKER